MKKDRQDWKSWLVVMGILLVLVFFLYANTDQYDRSGIGTDTDGTWINGPMADQRASAPVFSARFVDESRMEQIGALSELSTSVATPISVIPTAQEYCGDNRCDVTEDCSSCAADCGCKTDSYCSEAKICAPKVQSGDGICSPFEKQAGGHCSDCGCSAGVCNPTSDRCEKPAAITVEKLNETIAAYVNESGFDLQTYTVIDSFFKGKPVKLVFLECGSENGLICSRALTVSANGTVLDEADAT